MSVHVPGFVVEPEYNFLNFSRIKSCRRSFRVGIVHETVNVTDLVISEATLDEHVISTPVWINPNTSFPSICVRHVLCRKEVLQGLSRTSRNSLIPAIRKSRASFLYPFLSMNSRINLYPSGFARSGMSNSRLANASGTPPSRRTIILGSCNHGFDLKSVVVQTPRGQTVETRIQLEIVIIFWHFDVNRTATCSATSVARSVQLGSKQYFKIE